LPRVYKASRAGASLCEDARARSATFVLSSDSLLDIRHSSLSLWSAVLPALPSHSPLHRALRDVPGVLAQQARLLEKEGVASAQEVLQHLPFRHEDRRRIEGRSFEPSDIPACHHVVVVKTGVRFFGHRRGGGNFEAVVQHAEGSPLGQQLTLRWWNMPFMAKAIAEGHELMIHGKIKDFKGRLSMDHPEYELLRGGEDDEAASIHSGRITPVYRLRGD